MTAATFETCSSCEIHDVARLESCMLESSRRWQLRAALVPNQFRCEEGTREAKQISSDHAIVRDIRSDEFSLGAEFVVNKKGGPNGSGRKDFDGAPLARSECG
jgi:hypothetical protein